jgi:hypothetical protein
MTRKEANVILDTYKQLCADLTKYPTNSVIEGQILVVESILIGLNLGWKELHNKVRQNIQVGNAQSH